MRESDRISGIQSPSAFCRRAGPYSVHQVPRLLLSLICPRADRTAARNTCQRYPNRMHRRRNARNTRPRRLMSRREPSDFPLPKHSLSTLGAQYLNTGPHTLTKSVSCCPVTAPPVYYLTCGDNYRRKFRSTKDLGPEPQIRGPFPTSAEGPSPPTKHGLPNSSILQPLSSVSPEHGWSETLSLQ
jgi:hypothetical protein